MGQNRPGKSTSLYIILFTLIYCVFVVVYEHKIAQEAEFRIKEHGRIIADDLWNYNLSGPVEYLKLAATADNYSSLNVINLNGEVFQEIKNAIPDPVETFFIRLHLIPEVKLVASISHDDSFIGWIEAVWIPRTLYMDVAVLCFLLMTLLSILLYQRIISEKTTLEQYVRKRTNELSNSNLVLRKEIRERLKMDQALKWSEQKYRFLAENIEDVIWTLDHEGRCLYMSAVAGRMYGLDPRELEGTGLEELFLPHSLEAFHKILKTGGAGEHKGGAGSAAQVVELEMKHRVKGVIWCEVTVTFIDDGSHIGSGAMCVARNVTERKKAEAEWFMLQERLERSKKMESLGLLAGGVAHDLNNVLSGIVSYPELILLDLPEESPMRKRIETIRDSGIKAAEIVQDLLTLARRGVAGVTLLNLNSLVKEYHGSPEFTKMMSYHDSIEIEISLEEDLPNMYGSAVQLKKSIMNLVSNAAEAQPEGGVITISTKSRYLSTPLQGYQLIPAGEYVILSVADRGEGITASEMKQIFEPFYTRKVMGRSGTGLGLTVVWGTVEDHKGFIDISSSPQRGTAMNLYLPLTRDTRAEDVITKKDLHGNGETILVIDDVAHQRDIAADILTRLRYRVETAASGEEAVEYLRHHHADLVILDMIMGAGMDGLETYRAVLSIHPLQKAIIASGYSTTDRVREAMRIGAGSYLQKPYMLQKIGEAVQAELRSK